MTKIEVAPWIEDYVVDMEELYTEVVVEQLHNKPQGEETTVVSDYKELFNKCLTKCENDSEWSNFIVHDEDKKDSELSHLAVHDEDNTGCLCFYRKRSKRKGRMKNGKKLLKAIKGKNVTVARHKQRGEIKEKAIVIEANKSVQSDTGDKILAKGDPGMGKTTWSKKVAWDWAKGLFQTFSLVFFVFLKLVKPGSTIENIIIEQNSYMTGLKIRDRTLGDILEISITGVC